MRRLAALVIAGMLVGGCTGSAGDPSDPGGTMTTTTSAGSEPAAATTIAVEETAPLFGGIDGRVTLLTAVSGGSIRPTLEWEPVTGADHYVAFLYAPDGRVYWSWAGGATAVPVGGEPRLRDDAPGPSVIEGMSWAVIAYDADLLPIAVSELRPIAP
jgi:hypothetical protein